MDLTRRYAINKDKIAYKIIDDEAVMLNLDNGYYYSLNKVGTRIWQMIEKGEELIGILSFLNEEYQMEKKRLKDDLISLVKDLEKENLIELRNIII